ncbi:MAG: sigma-54 dependent transcriptional regulator [Verrucomicrobiia bacterium]
MVVEDDARVAAVLTELAAQHGYQTRTASTVRAALELLRSQRPDLLLLDHGLPDGDGSVIFEQAIRFYPSLRSVMLTGFPSFQEAVRLTQRGLWKYLPKPFDLTQLGETMDEVATLVRQERSLDVRHLLITHSPQMRQVMEALRMAAPHWRAAVLFTGETGTGKEVLASTLHELTWKQKEPRPVMVPVNCAAIPAELMEAELFGALQGSFTGAQRNRTGLVAAAEGGTLFLDEIGEMPLALQSKLLRFLESREYRMLGSTRLQEFNGRIIVATNRDLQREVAEGNFREDLYHRLNVLSIHLPPLRERPEDILPLAMHFLETICREVGRPILSIQPSDANMLRQLPYPGNARELRNLIERAVIQTPLKATSLCLQLPQPYSRQEERVPLGAEREPSPTLEGKDRTGTISEFLNEIEWSVGSQQLTRLEAGESFLVREALRRSPKNLSEAARWLGITRQALYRKMKKLKIPR